MVRRIRSRVRGVVLGALLLASSGCTDLALYDLDYIWGYVPWLSTLRGSVSYKPYEMPRLPAEGSIPVATPIGDVPPPFTQQDLATGNLPPLTNPLPVTPEVLERGAVVWERQCSVCHGPEGEGNGTIIGPGRFPFAPAITTPVAAGYSDAYLYGIIRVGRGLMPAYGDRIRHLDRWALVHYMRQIQTEAGLAPAAPTEPAPIIEPGTATDLPTGVADTALAEPTTTR